MEAIPYKVIGGLKFYDRMEIKDMLSYLRVIHNPNDIIGIKRIINVPSRKIGITTLQKLDEYRNNFFVTYFQIFENIEKVDDLNSLAKKSILGFYEILLDLIEKSKTLVVYDLLDYIIEKIKYKDYLKNNATKEEFNVRIENLSELKNITSTYNGMNARDSLAQFLEEVALITDMDLKDNGSNFVTLMTIHTSKGLEYNRVFITGLEEGLFPSSITFNEPHELEEEKRLMYVAMTRAKNELYISKASNRFQYGNYITNPPSRFIKEINPNYLENYDFGYSVSSNLFSNNYVVTEHDIQSFRVKKTIIKNDVFQTLMFEIIVSHPKFGFGIIIFIEGDDLAEIKFGVSGVKKMNIKIAPVKKI